MADIYKMGERSTRAYELWEKGKNKEAFRAFSEAAHHREKIAYNTLAYFYDHGIGTKIDREKALGWYRRAARIGDSVAQYNLGLQYLNEGRRHLARIWLVKAAAGGNEEATVALKRL